jgi:hypothetical protein
VVLKTLKEKILAIHVLKENRCPLHTFFLLEEAERFCDKYAEFYNVASRMKC